MKKYKIFILDHRTYCVNSIGDSLAQLGHEIFYQSSSSLKNLEAGLSYFKPDILLTVGYNRKLFGVFKDHIHTLCKKHKLFHIYWATEDLINHIDWSIPYVLSAKPDVVWTIHPQCVEKYKNINIPSMYFNFAFNPRYFLHQTRGNDFVYDVVFVGATHFFKDTYRFDSLKQLLFPLVKANIKTDIWGLGWKKDKDFILNKFGCIIPPAWLHGHLLYGKTGTIYRKSKIILGIQNAKDQVTQRTFEILGSGCFMLASRTTAMEELFDDKNEVALSSSPEETIELANFYLKKPELRFAMGKRAREKILNHHTYIHRINAVWAETQVIINNK